jgi:hypothetical protein
VRRTAAWPRRERDALGEGKLELQQGPIPAGQKRDDVLLQVKPASVRGSDMIRDDHGLTNQATGAVSCWVGFNPKST